ncbi:MAG: flavodoxin domain-containing protein [Thermostichales cyanobacterium BF4_bins_65]
MIAAPTRDVQILPIAPHTTLVRSRSWTRLRFETEYGRQKGTTANSSLIAAESLALLDPPGESFTTIFLEALGSRFRLDQIRFVILGHTNANRVATLKRLVPLLHPQVRLVCSNPAAQALASLYPEVLDLLKVVRGEESLDLGQGHVLHLMPTPLPRWPDHLCTYDELTGILWTDKLFAAHVCGDQVFDGGWPVYEPDRQFYYEVVLASQARQVELALERILTWDPQFYVPAHGPLVQAGRHALTEAYQRWNQQQKNLDLRVALIYASAYGNTTTIAEALAMGMTQAGVAVERLNCEVQTPGEIQTAVERADGILIGSPTLGGHLPTQVQTALGIILASANRGVPVGVFGSFGWSGEGVDLLESKLREAGFSFGFEPIRVKFSPTEAILQQCQQIGADYATLLKRERKRRQATPVRLSEPADRLQQAFSRVISSVGIITRPGLTQASLVTSLAQATFNPPGFTFALSKSDPLEPHLYLGDPLVLNLIPEGSSWLRAWFKQPSQTVTELAHTPYLPGALSYLEGTVRARMDVGDHWIIYAVSSAGKVLQTHLRPQMRR